MLGLLVSSILCANKEHEAAKPCEEYGGFLFLSFFLFYFILNSIYHLKDQIGRIISYTQHRVQVQYWRKCLRQSSWHNVIIKNKKQFHTPRKQFYESDLFGYLSFNLRPNFFLIPLYLMSFLVGKMLNLTI